MSNKGNYETLQNAIKCSVHCVYTDMHIINNLSLFSSLLLIPGTYLQLSNVVY